MTLPRVNTFHTTHHANDTKKTPMRYGVIAISSKCKHLLDLSSIANWKPSAQKHKPSVTPYNRIERRNKLKTKHLKPKINH